ncbi:MAG: putative lipid II flippase FtsW [Verrucomicrobia bacterium]|nr:putative lipid II flippase FtsW [Verrucomicrobiota bacterium]
MQRHAVNIMLLMVAGLTALGLVMLFSTGGFAKDSHGDIYHFVKRQAVWMGIGIVIATAIAWFDYRILQKLWLPFLIGTTILLVLCFVPGIGLRINGSSRWINTGIMAFQPSEAAKLSAIVFLAWWFSRPETRVKTLVDGIAIPLGVLSIPLLLILLEVDMGTTALIGATALTVMFIAGAAMRWLVGLTAAGFAGLLVLAFGIDERQGRMLAFLNPEKYALGEGLQQWQALIAFGSGGFGGVGLGEGRQKMLYLPYAHTDFIFPMIGEELGLKATVLVVLAYLVICICGLLIAANSRERFGMLLGFGAVMVLTIQAAVNIGVTTSLLPNKGMPLPFISYGGSNLVVCLALIGLLVGIHRRGRPVESRIDPTLLRPHFEPRV